MCGIVIENMNFRRTITALFLCCILGSMLCINVFADDEDFIPRTTAPDPDDSIYSANFFALYVTEISEDPDAEPERIDPMPAVRVMFLIIIAAVVVVRGIPAIKKCYLSRSKRPDDNE